VSASEAGPPRPAPPVPRYWAFLSYSHHDRAVARRLQRQLETYRLPRRLVGRETPLGPVPARLSPLFRDRDELNAGADLKASVQEALAASRWLVVVCTPDAARSPWVNREIVEFKRLHGEGRVLALIAAGEPFASQTPGREASECFPPALRFALTPDGRAEGEPLEPIAADMRAEGDGPRRAVLKLLAGMVGVGFDDLVQRDTQRRLRWLAGIAGASTAGVVVFAALAVLAVQARNEAQHQRAQAEGLIEFMLGDLRRKLEPVGRLEVLDSVGEKALAYYASQQSQRLDATALGHRSRAMHLIGEIRDLRGNPAQAQAAFEQAAATTARLLERSPQDGQRIFDHSQSVYWVGYAAWKRADAATASAQFNEYLALSRRLVQLDPKNLDWRAEVAFAHGNVGMVQLATGQAGEALRSLQNSGALLAELAVSRPELSMELAHSHGWQADAYELLGDYPAALAEQRRKMEIFRSVPESAKNRAAQRGILSAWNAISQYELAMGQLPQALASVRAGLEIAERLVKDDPDNLFWRGDACFSRIRLAEIELAQGERERAAADLGQVGACVDELQAAGSLGMRYAIRLTGRRLSLAAALSTEGRSAELQRSLRQFLDLHAPQLVPNTPDRAKLAVELSNAALSLAGLQRGHDDIGARRNWEFVVSELGPYADMRDGAILTPLARARLQLGDVAAAQALAERVGSTSYRHPAYAELLNQLKAARGGTSKNPPNNPGAKT